MPIQIIDHTFRPWLARKRQENGAATYSQDIVDVLIPELVEHLQEDHPATDVLISTAPPLAQVEDPYILCDRPELVIQFLHTYPYKECMRPINSLLNRFPQSKVILITAYLSYDTRINQWAKEEQLDHRVKSVFIPMFIQPDEIQKAVGKRHFRKDPDEKRIIYFGNLYQAKMPEYHRLRQGLERAGWTVDVISKSRLNGQNPILSQEESWKLISQYQYGIGVGRCALEMYQLGLKVLISGEHWGGLCMDSEDYFIQQRTNFNGRTITGTRDLEEALELLPLSGGDFPIQFIPLCFPANWIKEEVEKLVLPALVTG